MKNIRVKGKNKTRLPGKNPFVVFRHDSDTFSAKVYLLCQQLELPCLEHISQYQKPHCVPSNYTTAEAELEANPEKVLHSTLELCLIQFEKVWDYFQHAYQTFEGGKWLADYKNVYPIILPKLKESAEESEEIQLALLELFCLYLFLEERHALIALVPWYIRYAPVEDITDDRLINVLASLHHDEYIARLPADELFEFLTSDKESARIRAKNKVTMEMMGEFDEA